MYCILLTSVEKFVQTLSNPKNPSKPQHWAPNLSNSTKKYKFHIVYISTNQKLFILFPYVLLTIHMLNKPFAHFLYHDSDFNSNQRNQRSYLCTS